MPTVADVEPLQELLHSIEPGAPLVQGARSVLDRHAGGPVDQLQQAPLPVELVAARHPLAILKVGVVRCQQLDTSSPFRLYVGREGHEVGHPLLGDKSRAVDKAAVEPRLPAEAYRRHPAHRRRGDPLENRAG